MPRALRLKVDTRVSHECAPEISILIPIAKQIRTACGLTKAKCT